MPWGTDHSVPGREGAGLPPDAAGAAGMLALARTATDAAAWPALHAGAEAWVAGLVRHPAFRATTAEERGEALRALLAATGDGMLAALLLEALRGLPPGTEAGPLAAPLTASLAAMLAADAAPRPAPALAALLALEEASAGLEGAGPEALDARFLLALARYGLALRLGTAPAYRARLLRDLAALVAAGAAAFRGAAEAATAEEEGIRAALNDPARAMRLHYLVPRRSMAAGGEDSLRKQFAREDALAAEAQARLRRAVAVAAALRADVATLEGLWQRLGDAAAAVLAEGIDPV